VSSGHPRWLLCGGIGSGKSEVRRLLAEHGIETIDADTVGHRVLDAEGFAPVAARWPEVVLEGQISRQALARVVFDDPDELSALEAITHPLIFGRIRSDLEGFSSVAVVEVPIIETSLGWPRIVVDSTDEDRMRRAVERGMALDDVKKRMAAQPDRAEWLAVADLVLPNHGDLSELRGTVFRLGEFLRNSRGGPG
jgi:dephospho-CoA kinase